MGTKATQTGVDTGSNIGTDKPIDLSLLKDPFPVDKISWRVGPTNDDKTQGIAFAYIDARDVYDRLDEVCGAGGWQCKYSHANGKTVCDIGIKIGDEWVWKANGAGDTDMDAEKGALSDALKRAGVPWGIGRYLYDFPNVWVQIEKKGRSYQIVKHQIEVLKGEYRKFVGEEKKAFGEPEMKILIDQINECAASIELTPVKDNARAAYPRMDQGQKAKITRAIKAKETELGNREMDQQMRAASKTWHL
jgi:hypothetical protein